MQAEEKDKKQVVEEKDGREEAMVVMKVKEVGDGGGRGGGDGGGTGRGDGGGRSGGDEGGRGGGDGDGRCGGDGGGRCGDDGGGRGDRERRGAGSSKRRCIGSADGDRSQGNGGADREDVEQEEVLVLVVSSLVGPHTLGLSPCPDPTPPYKKDSSYTQAYENRRLLNLRV